MRDVARQTLALARLVGMYWARAGLPNRLRKDQGRRASGALLRGAFLLLMVNWGYRIGNACTRIEEPMQPKAVAWLLLGLLVLSFAWGAMGRGPAMRAPQTPMTAPLLDTLPLSDASRTIVGLVERVMLYALTTASLFAASPEARPSLALVGMLLPTAGVLAGDAVLRLLRTVVSPLRIARVAVALLVLQFPAFMIIGGAPVLAKLPRVSRVVAFVRPAALAVLEGRHVGALVGTLAGVVVLSLLAIRAAERIGYDRVDLVPPRKLAPVPTRDLDLVRIEAVLAKREPGGRWLARGAFLYTAVVSLGLLAIATFGKNLPLETAYVFVRSLGFIAIIGGFIVVQNRASRMVLRDAGARSMLAPLPITPSDLLRGKTRALLVQALFVASPYLFLVAMPGPLGLKVEVVWRGVVALAAVALVTGAMVAVAFLTQGVGVVRVAGGTSVGIETTLVAMPLFAVAAAPYPWSAVVSLGCLGLLAFEARRSALRVARWLDDADDFTRETPVWRALLVYASFQAAQTLAQRALAFAPFDDAVQVAMAYSVAAVVLVALTAHARREMPPMRTLPERAAAVWLAAALAIGATSGGFAFAFGLALQRAGIALPRGPADAEGRVVVGAVAVVLAPLAEELFFRGWLQSAAEGELPPQRRWLAPLLAAFAFAAVQPPLSFVPALVLGLATGLLFARTRAVMPPLVAHAAHAAAGIAAALWLG